MNQNDYNDWARRAHLAIAKCLSLLGYATGEDREKALARFLSWLAFFETWVKSRDSEAEVLWTEALLQALKDAPNASAEGRASFAVEVADAALAARVRRFPPRMIEDEQRDTYPSLTSDEMVTLAVNERDTEWRQATGFPTPETAAQVLMDLESTLNDKRQKLADRDADLLKYAEEIDAWRRATGINYPSDIEKATREIEDVKQILARVLNCETERPLTDLVNDVVEVLGTRERAAQTVAEHALAKVRADLHTALRENATLREERDAAINCAQRAQEAERTLEAEIADCRKTKEMYRDKFLREEQAREQAGKDRDLAQGMFKVEQEKRDFERKERERIEVERNELRAKYADATRCIDGVCNALGVHVASYDALIENAKTAILPKPKPEKVEAGQKWAFVMTAINTDDANLFVDEYGDRFEAGLRDISNGFFLG